MPGSVEFLLGLLDGGGPAAITAADLDGPHGDVIRAWQKLGLIHATPSVQPALTWRAKILADPLV